VLVTSLATNSGTGAATTFTGAGSGFFTGSTDAQPDKTSASIIKLRFINIAH
jgi:hypothetical protein